MTSVTLRPAVFLDRDGVIIENRADYVKSLAEVQFIPGALTALARLARYNLLIVIVNNHTAIAPRPWTEWMAGISAPTIRRTAARAKNPPLACCWKPPAIWTLIWRPR